MMQWVRGGWRRIKERFDPQAQIVARVRAAKQARAAAPLRHLDRPRVSLIVLSFNHCGNVAAIVDGLRRAPADELIVCDDGSLDGADREWQRLLTRPNDFLIRSNDIHDSRIYNRAASLARGEIIAVLQDDDIPPASAEWLDQALALFERYPKLAVLGGHQGWTMDFSAPSTTVRWHAVYGYREAKRFAYARDIPYRDPVSAVPFMFVQGVSIGPIFYRRDVFLALGGFNLDYSAPGEVGMLVDHELSLRAWLAGHQVAVYGPAPFTRYVGGQGTVMFGRDERERGLSRNFSRLQAEYGGRADRIDAQVEALNRTLAGGPAQLETTR